MPTFDFTSPDGKSYSVQGPDGATPEQAFQMLQQHIGAPEAGPQVGMGEDAAKSVGSGLAKTTIGTIGGIGDLRSLASRGVDAAGDKLGFDPSAVKGAISKAAQFNPMTAAIANAPTSQQVRSTVTDPIVDPDYKPQYATGEIGKKIAEFAPNAAFGGGVAGIARNVVAPALGAWAGGKLTDSPYGEIVGGLLGGTLPSALRRVATPLPASAERQALTATLRDEGVNLTAGQATGRKPLQWMESALGDTPGSGGPAARIMENQGEQFTAAALRRAGIDAPRATPEVIDNAFHRIGGNFEAVAQRNNVLADRRLGTDLTRVEREYNNVVSPSNRAPVIENTARDIGEIMAQNGGHLTGQQYNAITSRLARQARGAQADAQLREGLQGMRTALDDAMERTLFRTGNSADMQILRTARNEYRNMMVLEKAATGAGSNAAEGLISPSQLRNAVVQQSRRAYGRGQGDFAELARAGEALLKPLPNSGTSPRHNVTHMLQTIGAIVGGAGGSAGGPGGAAAGAIAGLAAPAVAGRALLSRPVQAWLSNQRFVGNGNANPARERFMNALLSSSSLRSTLQLPSP